MNKFESTNKFEQEYYVKNQLGLNGMNYEETMQTLEFAKRQGIISEMYKTFKAAEKIKNYA